MRKTRAEYPNLELMEYMFKQRLQADKEWVEKYKEIKEQCEYAHVSFNVVVFPQVWGSTCTAFDVMPDGSPAIGGCAMTETYTVVFHENLTDCYCVFVDGRPCYLVNDATSVFYEDLKNCNMKSLSEAKKHY